MIWLDLFLLFTFLPLLAANGDVVVCGGFIKSSTPLLYSSVRVGVFTLDGILKESTECAPHNGYFLLPVYTKGPVVVKVLPPEGWAFEPSQIGIEIDGANDMCSKGKDINFDFMGYTVSGRVLSKGLQDGPAGVSVILSSPDGAAPQHTVTEKGGVFLVRRVISGHYDVSVSHPQWRLENPSLGITVGKENFVIEGSFVVISYDVQGFIRSGGQPVAGVEVYLTPLSDTSLALDGCTSVEESDLGICKVVTNTEGLYRFPALSPGDYKIVPLYRSERSKFDVSPRQLTFTVTTATVEIGQEFSVNGFAVSGRVLDGVEADSKPLPGAAVFINGQKVADTNAEGMFELTNVTAGQYEVVAKIKGYYFSSESLEISPNNPTLPDLRASAYQLCGQVSMSAPPPSALPLGQRKVGLKPAGEDSNAALVTTATDETGTFCFKVSPGEYVLQPLVGAAEHRDGLRLLPEAATVTLSSAPLNGVAFSQYLAALSGSVSCLGGCEEVTVQVTSSTTGNTATVQLTESGSWRVDSLLPGLFTVTVAHPFWCWKEAEREVTLDTDTTLPPFEQSGYLLTVDVSHAILLNFSIADQEKSDFGTFSLTKATNRFCLKKAGTYRLVPSSCYTFPEPVYSYDTSAPTPLTLTATQFLVTGTVVMAVDDESTEVTVTNTATHAKVPLRGKTKAALEDGRVEVTYEFWSSAGQKFQVKPTSATLLFSPTLQTVTVSGEACPVSVSSITGKSGTFVSGKISPAVSTVLVTLTAPEQPDLKLTQITDEEGMYNIGPLSEGLTYTVTAEKQGYEITPGEGYDFTALKLSKLTTTVQMGEGVPLVGVLVSVSGSKGYRKNVQLESAPLVLTGLVPGDYFIRPLMKEYSFTPASKMLTVDEGLEVDVTFTAERVAYSGYGKVTSLNGRPQPGIVVEAVGAGDCALQEEGVTGEDGSYRIRGLSPNCPLTFLVRSDKSDKIRRASPSTQLIEVGTEDRAGINFIVFQEPTTFDITGYVEISPEYVSSTKVLLIEDRGSKSGGKQVHTSALDESRIFVFPEMALTSAYNVKIESSLPHSLYNFTVPDVKLKSEGPFQHVNLAFLPIRKSVHQEQVTRASFTALTIIVLSMVLAANHATLVPVFTQVYHSVVNRGGGGDSVGLGGPGDGMEYIDDIHKGGMRRSKSKKK